LVARRRREAKPREMPRTVSASAPDVKANELLRAGRVAEALPFARRAVAQSPVCSPAHGLLATILLRLGERDEAETVVAHALTSPAGSADAYDALAFVSFELGAYERANALYRRAVERAPEDPRFWYNLATSERSFGRLGEAAAACDRAIELNQHHYQSYLLRSELRTQVDSRNHVEAMERLLTDPAATDRAHIFLGYALGKELDDLGQYDRAFHWFSEGAKARRRHLQYDVRVDEKKLARIVEVFPGAQSATDSRDGDSPGFIFIVGLPRSGTTLLERILTRLPNVVTNGETETFSRALFAEASTQGPDAFARAAAADFDRVGRRYVKLASHSANAKVIEKLPLNYLYLGAIRRALPAASAIHLNREPLDSCFAMFRTLFGEAYPFTYDFTELAGYYAAYARLMGHWRAVLENWLLETTYEKLVSEPAHEGARIASAARLDWDPSAIEIHRSGGVSTTASASQIRRQIYQSSVGKWRHYRRHLTPLIAALRSQGVTMRDVDS
jgi:tetratricopeptide (TPR) repeat protein